MNDHGDTVLSVIKDTDKSDDKPDVVFYGKSKRAQVLQAIGIFLFGVSFLLSQIFSWSEVANIRNRFKKVTDDRRSEQQQEDCRNLYTSDLILALGQDQIAFNEVLVAVVSTGAEVTDELIDELIQANVPLREAIEGLETYRLDDPPPSLCPHPIAVSLREAQD